MVEQSKIVLATKNQGKLKEFKDMITKAGLNYHVLSLGDFPQIPPIVENGNTFKENAFIKATTVVERTGFLSLADDSGLEVDYLNGAPGIYSARFAGEPKSDVRNNEKLLKLLEGIPLEDRTARFRCVIAIVTPSGEKYFTEGICEGLITTKPRGENGFGFDPLFYLPQYEKTMAEIPVEIKNQISHRAKAFKNALGILENLERICFGVE